ncbi:MAG: AAA family ATPase [Patescibacteria group bacterium]
MKLTIINGSPCSGKSTIIKRVLKEKEHFFYLSYDSLKWQFSNYVSGKYKEDILEMLLVMAERAFDLQYDVVSDVGLTRVWREKLKDIAVAHKYEIVEINLEADFDVCATRFDERVLSALTKPESRIANTSKEKFKEMYDLYQTNKNPNAITLRTDVASVEEVRSRVLELL